MRRLPALLLLCLSVALVAAAPPPKVTPSPAPTPAPAASPVHLPLVIVYPFEASSDIKADVGQRAAQLFVQQMNAAGGIDTILSPPTVKRADYLTNARKLNADYYVAGYMTPLGDGVSLVEQVVSTQSGTITYGATAQIASFEDATSQAVTIHDAIEAREKSLSAAYAATQAEATSTPAPKSNQVSKSFSDIAGLFKRHGKETSAAPAGPIVKPAKGILVVHVSGHLPQNDLNKATSELFTSLNAHYNVRMSNAPGQNLSKEADGICGSDRNNTIATGTASAVSQHHGFGSRTTWTFVLDVYTCWGAKLAEHSATSGSLSSAVSDAVAAYAKASPENG